MSPELESLKCNINLIDYARARGYEPRARESGNGITLLEDKLGDRVAVVQDKSGQWLYANVRNPYYFSRGPDEPRDHALGRLQFCIERSRDRGDIVDFVRHRERLERGRDAPQPTFEQVRAHLKAWREAERALGRPERSLSGQLETRQAPPDRSPQGRAQQAPALERASGANLGLEGQVPPERVRQQHVAQPSREQTPQAPTRSTPVHQRPQRDRGPDLGR
jgi:hypothetical protein